MKPEKPELLEYASPARDKSSWRPVVICILLGMAPLIAIIGWAVIKAMYGLGR